MAKAAYRFHWKGDVEHINIYLPNGPKDFADFLRHFFAALYAHISHMALAYVMQLFYKIKKSLFVCVREIFTLKRHFSLQLDL